MPLLAAVDAVIDRAIDFGGGSLYGSMLPLITGGDKGLAQS